jgi:hypothetical protein
MLYIFIFNSVKIFNLGHYPCQLIYLKGCKSLMQLSIKMDGKPLDPTIKINCKQTFCYTLTKSLQHLKIFIPLQPTLFLCVKICTNAPKNNEYGNTPLHILCVLGQKTTKLRCFERKLVRSLLFWLCKHL